VAAGVRTIGDLAACGDAQAVRLLGSGGAFLRDMARGIDEREVITEHERKSIGAETTFARDLVDGPEFRAELQSLADEVARRMRKAGARASTIAVKLRYHHFKTISRQQTLAAPTSDGDVILATAAALIDNVAEPGDQFRLLGIQCSKLVDESGVQGVLWEPLYDERDAG
jgi:DNA polymerase-4